MKKIWLVVFAAVVACLPALAQAQAWPTKPVRVIVPFPPGGPSDTLGRVLAQGLAKAHGQQFIIENRPGAGGNIGAELVAKSAPDGYTIFLSPPGPHAAHRFLYSQLPFDPERDFTPIVVACEMPLVFMVNPKLPVNTLAELVDYARKNPGTLSYASPGNGTIGQLAGELFKSLAQVEITHIPYKGSAPALQDVLAGHVPMAVDNLPPYRRFLESGQLRGLGVTTEKRSVVLKNVPTMQEAGFRNFRASSWIALFGPARLPADIVRAINGSINDYLKSEEGSQRLISLGFEPVGGSSEVLTQYVRGDVELWGPVIQRLGIRAN
jgi:tripartite-type tricarboxylate transporter receptor subunit TctC